MRRFLFAFALLGACQITAPGPAPTAAGAGTGGDPIAVTTLADAPASPVSKPGPAAANPPPVVVATKDTPHPKPRTAIAAPATVPVQTARPDAVPEAPKSPEQLICEKTKGQWAAAGDSGASLCVKRTRDGGKQCSKKGECQGQCLARSGTCSPIDPMIGCNDILEADGRMVTLCLN